MEIESLFDNLNELIKVITNTPFVEMEKEEGFEQISVKEEGKLGEKDLFTELYDLIKTIKKTPFKSIEILEREKTLDLKQKIIIAKKIFK